MSTGAVWQLASIALLVTALGCGFAWFELSRPTARTVAAVAALVAFGVVARIVFAPFPNVKPTTDIIIIAGFALGFAPGWTVGVLTALVSNFYFGQGPWTPWQMLAWGVCGLIGALAARGGLRPDRRLAFAAVCAVAGLVYGLIVNFGSAVNLSSGEVWHAFAIQVTTSLPFDIAHATGNFVFFMLAGPLLVRMLARLKRRESLVWRDVAHASTSA